EPGESLPTEPPRQRTRPVSARLPRSSARSSGSASTLRAAGYVAGGLGLAGFVAVGVLSAVAFQEKGTADDHCPHRLCDDEGFRAAERGDRLLRLVDVGLVVGIV